MDAESSSGGALKTSTRPSSAIHQTTQYPRLLRCIEPTSIASFVAEKWQREPLLLVRRDPRHFHDVISLDEFDSIVSSTGLRHPYFRLFKEGSAVPVGQTTTARQLGPDVDTGLADLNTVYDQHADGATIVLQAIERWWPSFHSLCREFELAFGFPTQAHAYLTPDLAQGAPIHYDTHEVFVLQVEGTKRWRVWAPVRLLPMRLSEDRYDAEAVVRHAEENEPLLDVELGAGDSLYLPRGFIHEARAGESRSLHVTVSVMIDRWADLAEAVILRRLGEMRDVDRFRGSLPFGRDPFSAPDPSMTECYAALVEELLDDLDLSVGFELMLRKTVSYAAPSFRGRFLDLERVKALTSKQTVFVRSDAVLSLSEQDDGIGLAFGRTNDVFAPRFAPALRYVASSRRFRPCDLAGGLDEAEQIGLTRRLVEKGLCTLAPEAWT